MSSYLSSDDLTIVNYGTVHNYYYRLCTTSLAGAVVFVETVLAIKVSVTAVTYFNSDSCGI